jgi:hypothetical protein
MACGTGAFRGAGALVLDAARELASGIAQASTRPLKSRSMLRTVRAETVKEGFFFIREGLGSAFLLIREMLTPQMPRPPLFFD